MNKEFIEGRQAYYEGNRHNPYTALEDLEKFDNWEDGWDDAFVEDDFYNRDARFKASILED